MRVIGDPGPGRIITPPSAAVFSLRLTANAIGTFVSVLGLSLALLALAPMAFGFRSVVVASGSMAPALRASDVVVLDDVDDPPVGAVIDFQVGGERRIHRIVQTIGSEYTTKGDANATADGERVAAEDINGIGVMVVPFIGVPSLWLDQGRWLSLVALLVVIAAAVRTTPRRWLFRNDSEGPTFGAGR
ncbi:MAG: signal peptidase I [Acidimicrobiales bacterium]